jgi:hypothetical protein
MKKYLLAFLMVLILSISSIMAGSQTFTIDAYAPQKITFEETSNSFIIKSNTFNFDYGFYDAVGNLTDASNAVVLSIVSA